MPFLSLCSLTCKRAVIAFFIGLGKRTGKPLLNGHRNYFLALRTLCVYLDVGQQLGKGKVPLLPWLGSVQGCDSP